jgi:hypothetical protein
MPRSKTFSSSKGRPIAAALFVLALSAPLFGATAYHIELASSPASVVPLLSRFGTIEFHVYSGGVREESIWLDSFSRNGSPTITVMNRLARLYTDVPVEEFPAQLAKMLGLRRAENGGDVPALSAPLAGKVNGIAARRYRLTYEPGEWIDIWTTTVVPENAQLRRIVHEFVRHFAPGTAVPLARIPGNPIYVELNTEAHPKHPLLQLRSLRFSRDDEARALRVGPWYLRAPLIDAIWK